MTLDEALRFASGAGVNAIVGAALSFAAEYWPWLGEQEPKTKRLVFGALCLAIPVSATLLGVVTLGWSLSTELIWQALLAGLSAMGSGTLAHARKMGGNDD